MKYWNTASLFRENARYAYAVGNVRAMEPSLIDKSVWERLCEAKDAEQMGRILAETSFAGMVPTLGIRREWEKGLEAERSKVFEYAERLFLSRKYVELLRSREDFHNLRLALKEKYLGAISDEPFSPSGIVPAADVKEAALTEDWTKMPAYIAEAGRMTVTALGSRLRPSQSPGTAEAAAPTVHERPLTGVLIDELVDKQFFAYVLATSKKLPSVFFVELAKLEIDLCNVGTMLRVRRRRSKPAEWEPAFIAGGTLSWSELSACANAAAEEIPRIVATSELAGLVYEAAAYVDTKGSFARFHRLASRARAEFLQLARYVSLGPEPVFAFVRTRLDEISTLRMILIGKQNKVDVTVLAEYAGV